MKILIEIDRKLTARIRIWGQPMYKFWNFLAGQSIVIYVLVAVVFSGLHELNFWHFLVILALSYLIDILLQHFIRRQRPNFEKLTGYKMWIETYSFPSAHAAVSAGAATSLALLISFQSPIIAVVTIACMTVFAMLIGVSRIVVGVHYLADVAVGWILGIVVASGCVMVIN